MHVVLSKWSKLIKFFYLGENDVAKLLKDSGVSADEADLKTMMTRLKADGKSVVELMAEGRGKMQSVGAAPAGGAATGGATAGGDAGAGDDKKEEDKKEEEEDEGDIDMGGMFGDDDY